MVLIPPMLLVPEGEWTPAVPGSNSFIHSLNLYGTSILHPLPDGFSASAYIPPTEQSSLPIRSLPYPWSTTSFTGAELLPLAGPQGWVVGALKSEVCLHASSWGGGPELLPHSKRQ